MKKVLLTLFAALLMPVLALAQANMGITKTVTSYAASNPTDSHVVVPTEAVGMTLPATGAESYSIGEWVKITDIYTSSNNDVATNHPGNALINFNTKSQTNDRGGWSLNVSNKNTTSNTAKLHMRGYGDFGGSKDHEYDKVGGDESYLGDITLGEWHYVMIVIDNDNYKVGLYLDGKLVSEVQLNDAIYYGWADGVFSLFGYGCNGVIDEANFYNKALSADEAASSYTNAKSVSGLTAQYTFDQVKDGATGIFSNQVTDGIAANIDATWETYTCQALLGSGALTHNGGTWSLVEAAPTLVDGREILATEVAVTIVEPENGTLTATDGETTYNAQDDSYSILTGTALTLNATPAEGYALVGIYAQSAVGTTEVENGGQYVVAAETAFQAMFTNESYTLTIDVPEGVTANITRDDAVVEDLSKLLGSGVTYEATFSIPAGKRIVSVKLGDTELSAVNGKYAFQMESDATLIVVVEDIPAYIVTINQPEGGTVTVSKPNATGSLTAIASGASLSEGTVLTLSNTPDAGYTFQNYVVNGANYGSNTITVSSDLTISAAFEEGIEYCVPTYHPNATYKYNTSNYYSWNTYRTWSNLNITDGTTTENISGPGRTRPRDVYKDCTSTVFETEPGKTVSLTFSGDMNAMHFFVYVDWDKNGFASSDLAYAFNTAGRGFGTDSFTVPDDIAGGTYRVRYVVDWGNSDPCYFRDGQGDNGEIVVDFLLHVTPQTLEAPRTVTVETENADYGTVAITSPATEESSVSTDAKTVTIAATAAEGYAFMSWTDADGNVVSTDAVYTYTGTTDATFTANFGVEVTYSAGEGGSLEVTVEGAPIASGTVLPVGTEVTVEAIGDDGYKLETLTVAGETVEENPYTFTIETSANILASFTDAAYTLTININGTGGSITVYKWSNDLDEYVQIQNGAGVAFEDELVVCYDTDDENCTLNSITITGAYGWTDEQPVELDEFIENYEPVDVIGRDGFTMNAEGDVVITAVFSNNSSAIDGIYADGFDENAPVEYYNLQGVRVAAENLVPGFYIARQGAKAKKVLVTK